MNKLLIFSFFALIIIAGLTSCNKEGATPDITNISTNDADVIYTDEREEIDDNTDANGDEEIGNENARVANQKIYVLYGTDDWHISYKLTAYNSGTAITRDEGGNVDISKIPQKKIKVWDFTKTKGYVKTKRIAPGFYIIHEGDTKTTGTNQQNNQILEVKAGVETTLIFNPANGTDNYEGITGKATFSTSKLLPAYTQIECNNLGAGFGTGTYYIGGDIKSQSMRLPIGTYTVTIAGKSATFTVSATKAVTVKFKY
jgi:hypothetical protein